MNIPSLAAEIVTKVRNSMQDSALNQEVVVAGMIREAIARKLFGAMADRPRGQSATKTPAKAGPG